ncbi:MAG: IS3 family transposase, partial [Planctomycetota bacterium]
MLGVSRSGFYASRSRPPSRAKAENAKLTTEILEIHRASYGSPRVHAELRHRGHPVNRKRIA